MYISTFLTLDTALSGVEAAQQELATTGENITNADTPDYEEQVVNLVESNPLTVAGGTGGSPYQLGTGVDATSVTNVSSPYIDAAWRQQNANASAATTTQSYTQQIQTALNEPSTTGINAQLAQFWSDWNSLSDNPTSEAAQQAVVNDGEELSAAFNSLSAELTGSGSTSIMSQAEAQYSNLMAGPTGSGASGGEVYNDAYNIASLNEAIVQATAAGETPNTLIDQRNAAIDDLSSLGNVTVQDNSDGSVTVYFGGVTSTALVEDPVGASPGSADPGNNFGSYATSGGTAATGWAAAFQQQYATAGAAGDSAAQLAATVGGTLGSLVGLAGYSYTPADGDTPASGAFGNLGTPVTDTSGDTTYPDPVAATELGTIGTVSASLDAVASDLVSEVNDPTVEGSDPPTTIALTTDFFDPDGTTASTIAVNSALISDPSQVQVNSTGNPGDNDIALDEANNSGGTADNAYQAFVEDVGDIAQGANNEESTQSALSTQITNQRESVEGVDLSQEMSNLIEQQQAYEASAKVMNTFGTVMDSLLSAISS